MYGTASNNMNPNPLYNYIMECSKKIYQGSVFLCWVALKVIEKEDPAPDGGLGSSVRCGASQAALFELEHTGEEHRRVATWGQVEVNLVSGRFTLCAQVARLNNGWSKEWGRKF